MTQKEAVIEALNILHGEGELKWITLIALKLPNVDWSKTKTPEASVRRIVRTNPNEIIALGEKRYELVSHREKVHQHNEEIEKLRNTPTKMQFVLRLLDLIVNVYKYDKDALGHFYKLFMDADEEEAAKVVGKMLEKDDIAANQQLNVLKELAEGIRNVANKKTIGTLVLEQNNHGVNPELKNHKNDQQLLTNG